MSIRIVDLGKETSAETVRKEIVKYKGKYFIELEYYRYNESLAELSVNMASEIELLRKRIFYLEEKLSGFENQEDSCIIRHLPRE